MHVETERRAAFAAVDELRNRIVFISAIVALVVIALAFALAVSLTRPLESLTQGAQAVSSGDYSIELPVRTRDEIGYLTEVFNRMTATLKQSHERLEHLSTTDELTKLVNRRQLRTALAATLQRAKRSEEPFSLIMIDIDHFKAFNDELGHIKGDELLSNLGSFLLTNLRATDVAARYGGEGVPHHLARHADRGGQNESTIHSHRVPRKQRRSRQGHVEPGCRRVAARRQYR